VTNPFAKLLLYTCLQNTGRLS